MRRLLTLLLLAALTTNTALAADGIFNRKKERKRNKRKTEQVEAVKVSPEPQKKQLAEEVILTPDTMAVKVVENDITLNLTPDQVDSLITEWRELREAVKYDEYFKNYIISDSIRIEGTDSAANAERDTLYARRLKNLVSPIPLAYNYIVRASIDRYVKSTSGTISRILGLSQIYFPLIEDELMKAELPIELRAMPIIESALQVNAVSRAGAVGLWQFMPTTGKSYGLEVNSLVDERRDPIRSTQAAVHFLKDLYRMFGDWTLAIAAYNCGPGNVNKAIARSGGKTFWEIYDYLPRETRGYVPAFIAATYAFNYHRDHGIEMTGSDSDCPRYNPHQPRVAPRADCLDHRGRYGDPPPAQSAVPRRYYPRLDEALHADSAPTLRQSVHRARGRDYGQGYGLPQGVPQPRQSG